jgi:hypothetical protein
MFCQCAVLLHFNNLMESRVYCQYMFWFYVLVVAVVDYDDV